MILLWKEMFEISVWRQLSETRTENYVNISVKQFTRRKHYVHSITFLYWNKCYNTHNFQFLMWRWIVIFNAKNEHNKIPKYTRILMRTLTLKIRTWSRTRALKIAKFFIKCVAVDSHKYFDNAKTIDMRDKKDAIHVLFCVYRSHYGPSANGSTYLCCCRIDTPVETRW